ncbi:MAG: hypothetical protein RLZZ385_1976 [Pseudomonadota bacterium]|jgi:FkbM family methyltransferase
MHPGPSIALFLWDQSWLRPLLGKFLYRRLSAAGRAPDAPFEVNFYGLRYHGNLRNNIEFSLYHYGAFEKPLLMFLRDCLRALPPGSGVFCDIGANVGQHALFMAAHGARVHAFEPFAAVRSRLEYHIRINSIDTIVVHPVGLGAQDEQLPFFAPTGNNQGIGSFDPDSIRHGNASIGALHLVKGDDWFHSHGITGVQLMKIDVEGFERPVLSGLQASLRADRPVVVLEVTYDGSASFRDGQELQAAFPDEYRFFTFDIHRPDGRKAKRRESRAKRSGSYRLIPFEFNRHGGQDDVVACPAELVHQLPVQGRE